MIEESCTILLKRGGGQILKSELFLSTPFLFPFRDLDNLIDFKEQAIQASYVGPATLKVESRTDGGPLVLDLKDQAAVLKHSGGGPRSNPDEAHLLPPQSEAHAGRKTLVLDLDATLIDALFKKHSHCEPDFIYSGKLF